MSDLRTLALAAVALLAAVGAGAGLAGAAPTVGQGETTSVAGPLDENRTVTIVELGDAYGDEVQTLVDGDLPARFDTQVLNAADVNDTVTEATDVFVFNDLGASSTSAEREGAGESVGTAAASVDTQELITDVENDITTGAVYLDQWGSDSDAIANRSAAIGDPASTDSSFTGDGPVEYTIQQDHPIFDGVANASESVAIATGIADSTWFSGADGDTLAEVVSDGTTDGPAAAVDPDSGSVLLSSLGVTEFIGTSSYTDDASAILANGVVFADPPDPEAAFFAVSELSAPTVAPTGAEINVSATVENIGNQSGTGTVEFVFDGSVVANTTETLAAGANTTVAFSPTLPDQPGTFEHGIQTANDSQTASISVEEGVFSVSDLDAPREVAPGATVEVNATVTNTGNVSGTQDVTFVFDGSVVANTTETLAPGATTTVTFSTTLPDQEGFYVHGVFTDDDNETAQIGVGVELTDVAVVDSADESGDPSGTVAMFADQLSPGFTTDVVASTDVLPENLVEAYDIFVVQGIDESAVDSETLVTTIEEDITTGAVYLDQADFGDTHGIEDRSDAVGDPGVVDDDTGGAEPATYVIEQAHPIFDGVGGPGDSVAITDGEDNRAWFSDAAGTTLAEVGDQNGVDGAGVAVDPDTGAVLLSSIVATSIDPPEEFTAAANQTLANAVEFAQPPDLEGPYFAVDELTAPATGAVGEDINVSATVENIGNQSGTGTVGFVFDGSVVANATVQLDAGQNTTVEFSPTLPDEGGEFLHGVQTANDSQFAEITVEAPFFAVSNLSAPVEAETGAEINVSATVTNTGNVSGTQDVTFIFDGSVVANTTVGLAAGENTTLAFSATLPGQEGFYVHGVFTDGDNETAQIGAGVEFTDVAVVDNPSGDGNPAETVDMFVDRLPAGFTTDIVSSADVLPNNLTDEYDIFLVQDIDEEEVNVSNLVNTIESDTDSGVVYLDQSNFGDSFAIEDRSSATGDPGTRDDTTSGDEPVGYLIEQDHPIFDGVGGPGDSVTITDGEDNRAWFSNATGVTLAEVGDQAGVDGTGVAVDPDSQVVLLSSIMAHSLDSPDEFTAAANQTLANAVEFIDPDDSGPEFRVSGLDAPAEASPNTTVNVSATVTNVGFETGTQTVEFAFDGTVVANMTVALNATESTTVTFSPTLPDQAGTFTHGVFTDDDNETAEIAVGSVFFAVSELDAPTEADAGATINVSATVTNTGELSGTQDVLFQFNGSTAASETVSLNATENTTVAFSPTLPDADAVFEHGVLTANDSRTAAIAVGDSEITNVSIVESDSFAEPGQGDETLAIFEAFLPTRFQPSVVEVQSVDDALVETTDVFVFHDFGTELNDTEIEGLMTDVETDPTTNAVYLEQRISSNAISERSALLGDPDESPLNDNNGETPVEFVIETDHPIFDGVGGPGDTVEIHSGGNGGFSWFEGAEGDGLAEVQDQSVVGGPAAAVDPDSGAVLLASIATTDLFNEPSITPENYTDDAGQILANAVTFAEPDPEPAFLAVSNLTAPAEAVPGAQIDVNATVTNTGDLAGTGTAAFVFDGSTVANATVELNATESTTVAFSPTLPDQPGTVTHGVFTGDDNETAEITVAEPGPPDVTLSNLSIAGQGDDVTVIQGSYDVSVELAHEDGLGGEVSVTLAIGNETSTQTVLLEVNETLTVAFEGATGGVAPGFYDVTMSGSNASVSGSLTLSVDLTGDGQPATDTNGDGLLNDIDGDGLFDIFDVQALFGNLDSDPVQQNGALFDFDQDGVVDIFDVQVLFEQL